MKKLSSRAEGNDKGAISLVVDLAKAFHVRKTVRRSAVGNLVSVPAESAQGPVWLLCSSEKSDL